MPNQRKEHLFLGPRSLSAFAVALGVTSTVATAAGSGDPTDRRVTLSARNMDVKSALHLIASQVDANLALEGLSGMISFEVKDGKLRDVMDSFCEAYSCRWSLRESDVLLVQKPRP